MVRDAAVTLLLSRLGNRKAAEYSSIILLEMDEVQLRLEGDPVLMPWFMLTESSTSVTIIGDERVALPADFIHEFEDGALQVQDPTSLLWLDLTKEDYEHMREEYRESDPGQPKQYALVGSYFRVKPVPDLVYSIRMLYFAHQVLPSATNIENSWLKYASDLLLSETGFTVASLHMQDMELAQQFDGARKIAKDRLWKLNEARMHANRDYMMGSL